MKISSVACRFNPVKIDYSDYPKSFIRLNDVYVSFQYNIAIAIFY